MTTTKSLTLNNTPQMIDINNDYTEFRTVYNITCNNLQDDFEYALVPQTHLDKQIPYKKAIGYHEDSITNTNPKGYQDWYLLLRANKDTPCKIVLDIISLDAEEPPLPPPPRPRSKPQQRRAPPPKRKQPPVVYSSDSESDTEEYSQRLENTSQDSSNTSTNWYRYIFIGLLVLLIVLIILWWTGYLYKLPFMQRFKLQQPLVTVVSQSPPPITPQIVIQTTTSPPPPTDPNFINEMRELRID